MAIKFHELCEKVGSEEKAREILVAKLRITADIIEKNIWPKIYYCKIDNIKPTVCEENVLENIEICLSHPWGG